MKDQLGGTKGSWGPLLDAEYIWAVLALILRPHATLDFLSVQSHTDFAFLPFPTWLLEVVGHKRSQH